VALTSLLLAFLLPLAPNPASPFPAIHTDAPTITDLAPGISYGDYHMQTADGPLWVHVLAADLKTPSVRTGTALAGGRLLSSGETVSSMATRTGAIAGVNGDYFDINQTNQPLNVLIRDGRLIRMPTHRWAVGLKKDGTPLFGEFSVSLTASLPQGTIPLSTMNDWPAYGTNFITPDYGPLHPEENVTEFALAPQSGAPPFATYRITAIADGSLTLPPGYYLAAGPQSSDAFALPNVGDSVTIAANASPPIDDLQWAIGGGPLLVKDGQRYADPDGPSKGEFATHMPATAVGVTAGGTLLLFEVDGRQPGLSIGILQPQLAALMIAFGVQTGMQFDGGGSSTIVARMPGDAAVSVENSPSDGHERRVGDALLLYSDLPDGPPARIVSTPQTIRALPRAHVPLRIALSDEGGHRVQNCTCVLREYVVPRDAGELRNGEFIAGSRAQDAAIDVSEAGLHASIPVHVIASPAAVDVVPLSPDVQPRGSLKLQARAFDGNGYPIALPAALPWETTDGTIDSAGNFVAGVKDALVSVRIGDVQGTQAVTVGDHDQLLPFANLASFSTYPHDLPGGIDRTACAACVTLRYDFSGAERAAYANAVIPLPERALGISADVKGDGNGETLRVAVVNAIDERFLYTIGTIDWTGWRHVERRFPAELPQPVTLKSIYVIGRIGTVPPVESIGSVTLRNVRVILAGRADQSPK
jgi:hypothetical protein